jgi:membrane protein YdbS with pleckstrin-like domain
MMTSCCAKGAIIMATKKVEFTPLHGLASLGAGGLSVSFFVWLMFLTPHPNAPVPTYESLALASAAPEHHGWISFVTTMVAIMAIGHYALLGWWLRRGSQLPAADKANLFCGEAHVFRMITPLVLAMSVNAGFVVGLVFVPGLWQIKEWLFPLALLAFAALFVMATQRWLAQQARLKSEQLSYRSKGLIELLATFAFAMITVGFSASAAMSDTVWVHTTGLVLSAAGAAMAIWAAVSVLRDRMNTLRQHPVAAAATGSLLMGVPILTILGIASYRLMMAGKHHFAIDITPAAVTTTLAALFVAQVLIFLVATPKVLQRGGWRTLVTDQPQGASFSLICPGVGLFVLGMFLVAHGLAPSGLLSDTGLMISYGLLAMVQVTTLALFAYLLIYAMPGKRRVRCRQTHPNQPNRAYPPHIQQPSGLPHEKA